MTHNSVHAESERTAGTAAGCLTDQTARRLTAQPQVGRQFTGYSHQTRLASR